MRRLWAGELGGGCRYVFIVPTFESKEENADAVKESEEFQDILQTDLKLSDSHFHSKQVSKETGVLCTVYCFMDSLLLANEMIQS